MNAKIATVSGKFNRIWHTFQIHAREMKTIASLLLLYFSAWTLAHFEVTNINCLILDKTFASINYCHLKAVNRSYKYISAHIRLMGRPVTNDKVNYALIRRSGGQKSDFFNQTIDFCAFLKKPSYIVKIFFYDLFKDYSNFNHTCPIYEDLIVEKLPVSHLNSKLTSILPIPEGDYAIRAIWQVAAKPRFKVSINMRF